MWAYRRFRDAPRVLTREELYKVGLSMLRRCKKNVVAVSTVGREDSQNYFAVPGHEQEKMYYEQLFRIVQQNQHRVRGELAVRRYMDLADVNKCEEAISLLLYGAGIEIFDSDIQLEFLIRDDEEVLLGFEERRELSHGIKLGNKRLAAALNDWINGQVKPWEGPQGAGEGGAPAGEKEKRQARFHRGNLQEMVAYITGRRERTGKNVEPGSLIHAAGLLKKMGITDLFSATRDAFDNFDKWYPSLYDEEKSNACYTSLARFLLRDLFHGRPKLLDCGCAHALGANIFMEEGVEYWGVDASPKLIALAKARWRSKNFIDGDIVKVLLDREARTEDGRGLPKRFEVIACQGNTFDFFLGEPQKWFVLALFKRRLREGGILFFTQRSFTPDKKRVERKLPLGSEGHVAYNFEWAGHYTKLDVEVGSQPSGSVIQHPTDPKWLQAACEGLGFRRLTKKEQLLPEWFRPHGAEHPHDVYIFQLQD
ncbi:MAG TPA: methyltransferase domain-containing protein [Pyrinomonadaceae bacterium]